MPTSIYIEYDCSEFREVCMYTSTFLHRTTIQMMQQMEPSPVSSMTLKLMVCVNVCDLFQLSVGCVLVCVCTH